MFKGKQKKILSWVIILALLISNLVGLNGSQVVKAAGTANKTFDIIEITDFHGQLLDSTNTKPVGAALAKVVKDVKATNPDRTLIIGGGDLYQGTPVSNVLRGVPVQQVMSNIGMEVTALGNHEFDWGLDVVNNTTMNGANYSIVCANMYNKGTNVRPYSPYKIITKDGVRIAVIGAILKDAPTIIMPAFVAPFDFRDPATEISACAKEIRDGNLADIVLADVHDGGASLNTIVNNLHGVDAMFGGHTHSSYDDINTDGDGKSVPTLNAMNAGKGYIDLKITVDSTNKIIAFSPKGGNWKALTTTVDSLTDPTCKKIVDDASAALLPVFNVVVGNNATTFSSIQVDSPYGESQLGNWMADVVKNYSVSPADVGMVNNGGIRLSPIIAGDITVGTIFNIMPFDNTICTTTMSGIQLKNIFEQAVQTNGKGIQISGVKFTYDSTKPSYVPAVLNTDGSIKTPEVPGQRVLSIIRENDSSVVKDTDILKVNAPDFVATGGDNFTGFLVPTIKASLVDSHYTVRDALTDDVRAKGKITVVMNKRVDNQAAIISVIGTSDLHGAIFPIDYNTGLAANVGLAKVSTYVKSVRATTNSSIMLIDNGDTIQGTPLSYYYDMIDTKTEYPMMKVMGAMGYDTWTLGNHEFNYGLTTLNRIIGDATKENIKVLSANTYKSDNTNFVSPYTIKSFTVNGKTIKVAILGLTTKTIPSWEDPAHYADLHFNDLVLEAQKWVPIIKAAGADVVIASIHSGIKGASDTIPENQVDAVAQQVSGIDAILCGHTHTGKTYSYTNPAGKVVPVVEPKNGDGIFSQIDLNIDANGNYVGLNAYNVTLPTTAVADPDILALAQPYQDATLVYTNTVIGQSTDVFEGTKQLTEPSSIMELVNKVQANGAGTTLSIAAPLSPTAKVPQGDVKRQDIMGVYVYENYLFGLKMTGSQLKNWLEWSVRYYKQVASATDPIVKDSVLNIADYNLDQLYGATYDIDLTQPACTVDSTGKVITGNRIKNLKINSVLVQDTDALKVAVNNYRYNGGGGFMAAAGFIPGSQATIDATFYNSAKALGDDGQVRNMMFKYVQDNRTISPTNSNNWKIATTSVIQQVVPTGNSGGNGGGSTSVVITPVVTIPVVTIPVVVPIVTKIDSDSNVVATLDSSKIDINNVNVIKIDEPKPESKVLVQIPAAFIGTGTGSFQINTKASTLNVPTSVIDSSILSTGGTLQVSENLMPATDAKVLLQNIPTDARTNGKIFSFSMAIYDSNNKVVSDIHNFATGKSVAVTINLSSDDTKAMDTSKISAFYFDVTSKKWVDMGGSFDSVKMTYTFSTTHFTDFTIMQKSAVNANINRLCGLNRIETSIAIAKEQYTDAKPDAIVLATANGFADALAGCGLAYKYNAPMLLVNKTVSDSQTVLDYITTNLSKDKNIYILGETGAVSKEVSDYLTVQGYKIIRLGGKDRYETNQKIVDNLNVAKGTSLVIATVDDFADALSISSIADIKGFPILLNNKDNLSASVSSYITNIQPTTVYVMGGTGALSTNVEAQIKKLNGNITIVRLGGKDRYETSMMILDYFNITTSTITVATGKDFPDALSGSVLAAKRNSGILLVDNKDVTKQKALLIKKGITNVIVLGGEGVINTDIATSLIQK